MDRSIQSAHWTPFLIPRITRRLPRELRGSRQTAGVEVTSRDYSKTSNFVPRRMRKTRPVLSCHRQYSRGTAVGRQAARCALMAVNPPEFSHTRGKSIVETARAWRIRTHKCRFQNWPLKCGPNSLHFGTLSDQRLFPAELPKSDLHPSPVCNEYGAPIAPPLRSSHARGTGSRGEFALQRHSLTSDVPASTVSRR
jgi:hypothetical protein